MTTQRKITRISYNSKDWWRPTGEAGQEENGTYNQKFGFGHEDWLFRSEWLIDGWRYSFLQGVNKSYHRLINTDSLLDLTLFTIQSDKRSRLVASIDSVECLKEIQAAEALQEFKSRGWYDTMLHEIDAVHGDSSALGASDWVPYILNIRFRLENLRRFPKDAFISKTDSIYNLKRYQLYDLPDDSRAFEEVLKRRGTTSLPDVRLISRRGIGPIEYTPEHRRMQNVLIQHLKTEYPDAELICEENFIDIKIETALAQRI
jgi:hypothetical protein